MSKRYEVKPAIDGTFYYEVLGKNDKVLKREEGFQLFEAAVATANADGDPGVEIHLDALSAPEERMQEKGPKKVNVEELPV